jgi:spore germination cell wall hydrolase CwlJ-like protein
MFRKLLAYPIVWLLIVMTPVMAVLTYNDYQQRQLESSPEIYGVELASVKSKRLSKILPDQHEIIATNAYAEARGEGYVGMVAVTNVVTNRVKDPEFPKTYYEVITQPKQFSWLNSTNSIVIEDEHSWAMAQKVASLALEGKLPDYSNGARFYANVKKVDIKRHQWVAKYTVLNKVGNHTFMDKKDYVKAKDLKPMKPAKSIATKPTKKTTGNA